LIDSLGTCNQLFNSLGYTLCNQLSQKVKDEQASAFSRTLIAFSECGGIILSFECDFYRLKDAF
jgi:hypothetical protein